MSSLEREARKEENRQKDLRRPGRDAIEGVYPELVVNPASAVKAPAKAVEYIASKVLARPPKPLPSVEIGSRIRPSDTELAINRTFESLKQDSYKNASEAALAQLKDRLLKHYSQYDLRKAREKEARKNAEEFQKKQSAAKFSAYRRAGAEYGAGNFDKAESASEQEYKKGGAIKARKHRGDGIAQRGKTKGRFV
jgi:hypothetical protein